MNLPSLSRKNNAHVVLFLAALIFVDISWYRCAAQLEQIPKEIQGKKERKKDGRTSLKEIRLGIRLIAEIQGPRLGMQRQTLKVS
jgi:hypothetical protein